MRLRARAGINVVANRAGSDSTDVCIVGVSRVGSCVAGAPSPRKPAYKTPKDPVFRVGDPVGSDPWRLVT